mmetsp:Transcript_3542/g.7623  ORF Transcript_3542/g.7623 Transcript_3542/m.7623 type:complete len:639 (+) Transcript_3542:36-1952(+)
MTSFNMVNTILSLSLLIASSGPLATNAALDTESPHSHSSPSGKYSVSPVEYVDVSDPDFALLGYVSIPESKADDSDDLLPGVVIVPDWDNVNEYEMIRATMINEEFGWVGFVADIYGPALHDVKDFNVKMEQSGIYRSDPALFNSRIQSAINVLKDHPLVDNSKIAVIGYCLGGTGVLGYSFASAPETTDIVGAVSFHGGLMEFEVTGVMGSPVLVLSGGNDDAGTAVEDLEGRLNEADATWQITRYSGVEHGFTNFGSPAYNEWVDMRAWEEMGTFLKERFGEVGYGTTEPVENIEYIVVDNNETMAIDNEGVVTVETVDYNDGEFALQGFLAMPATSSSTDKKVPGVVILPDWDGVNGPTGYEAERAVLMAQEGGYVAMVADIYGAKHTNVESFEERIALATKYRSDVELFVSRIKTAVDLLVAHPAVDETQIFVAGYCLGGTGAIDYGFSSGMFENVKAVVPIHGGLSPLREIKVDEVQPYVLILSGGIDDAHGNPTELEQHLDGASATWEISRYSNAAHGFTSWGTGPMSAYNEMADSRSWWSMMSLFKTLTTPTEPEHVEVLSVGDQADVSSDEEHADVSSDEEVSTDASSDEEDSTDASSDEGDESSASTGATRRALFVSLAAASLVATIAW